MISVIIPAHDEERLIGPCLKALFACCAPVECEAIVVANGCGDATADAARAVDPGEWSLRVIELEEGGKPGALNAGDAAARYDARVYLDADVTVEPGMISALWQVLQRAEPAYASGRVRITGQGRVARRYARLWARLPFMAQGVPGCGLFAVNGAGRARWSAFPEIISDDTYVRLHFAPKERHLVDCAYDWPIAEGLRALVRVRRRQDAGVAEIAREYPELMTNEDKEKMSFGNVLRLALTDPLGFLTYADVALMVRLSPAPKGWGRSR